MSNNFPGMALVDLKALFHPAHRELHHRNEPSALPGQRLSCDETPDRPSVGSSRWALKQEARANCTSVSTIIVVTTNFAPTDWPM